MTTVTIRPAVDATELPEIDQWVNEEDGSAVNQTAEVFPQSVASGGPTPTGIILWTRINPEYYDPSKSLRLEVATDASFENCVVRSELLDSGVKPTDNYTVRVDLNRILDPDSVYYYRFNYRGVESQTGRCRTLPAEDASPESLRFGVLNCQNYQNGYFGAMAHLAETDVDFVLHLGDYIYENVADGSPNGDDGPYEDRSIDLPDGETRPMSLNDFRRIYETYKTDPYLQKLHERHTVIQTWDDHAIANDRYWDYEVDAPVFPDHPCGDVPEFTRYLTRVGIQAWWEFIPARITYDPNADHIHDSFELYQAIQFGDLVTLLLTDERLFRNEPLSTAEKILKYWKDADSSRTMLGATQCEWLRTEFRESETLWTAWANAVLFKPLYFLSTFWKDSWTGFESERRRIIETLADVRRKGETTVVTLTGDMHMTLATPLQSGEGGATPVGIELMTPSVTSINPSEKAEEMFSGDVWSRFINWILSNSHLVQWFSNCKLFPNFTLLDGANWGYSVIEFSRDACTWDVYWVDKTMHSASAECTPIYRLRLPAGKYEIQERHEEIPELSTTRSSYE